MIPSLYEPFKHWAANGSVFIISDLHFNDKDCKLMAPDWITPEKQIEILNKKIKTNDTLVCLGDVGNPEYISKIKAKQKILILGNHDAKGRYRKYFTEIYEGPVFISAQILLSHEPITGLSWCVNIHGHDHNNTTRFENGCRHLNLAANVCNYIPVSLSELIKQGITAHLPNIHRETIDKAVQRKAKQRNSNQ